MSMELKIVTAKSRSFQCDVAGCRNRTRYLISKRQDVVSHPLHLCEDCIRGLYGLLENIAPEFSSSPVDVPSAEVIATAPADGEAKGKSDKAEPKPNKARKTAQKDGK